MTSNSATALRQRLLRDIKELQEKPYPGIVLHVYDDLSQACLALSPEGESSLHLTISFGPSYPLRAPRISIESQVVHPNVFDSYICASILKNAEGYTPAYTLKGICIQLLSFFSSDKIEQEYGSVVDRADFRRQKQRDVVLYGYRCNKCGFGAPNSGDQKMNQKMTAPSTVEASRSTGLSGTDECYATVHEQKIFLPDLPDELLLRVCDFLEEEPIFLAARAIDKFSALLKDDNILRNRELLCFALKRGFHEAHLGIGVAVSGQRDISSEFDLLSYEAYDDFGIRRSVQGLQFEFWLPLPIAQTHWLRVRKYADESLNAVVQRTNIEGSLEQVIYHFINNIVFRLSTEAAELEHRRRAQSRDYGARDGGPAIKSSLTHASEKAIESYFHIFHLFLCLATERPNIVRSANRLVDNFINNHRDKQSVPNIGFLLIALLITDVDVTSDLVQAIVKETIIRAVVWMLEPRPRGKGCGELSFFETDAVSEYRLQKTFEAGKTGYRLLMFQNLLRLEVSKVRVTNSGGKMSLTQLRDHLFNRRGAPPAGAAAYLAEQVREIQKVNSFDHFLRVMSMPVPTASVFTAFLRRTVQESMDRGFSQWGLTQEAALGLRWAREGLKVGRPNNIMPRRHTGGRPSFFPTQRGGEAQSDRGNRSDRGDQNSRGGRGGQNDRGGSARARGIGRARDGLSRRH